MESISYEGRLKELGALIDAEIATRLKEERQRIDLSRSCLDLNIPALVNDPTDNELEEALLLMQNRTDVAEIPEFLSQNPALLRSFKVFKAADDQLRQTMLSRLTDAEVKRLFRSCCCEGERSLVRLVMSAWIDRLMKPESGSEEPCLIQVVRSGDCESVEEVLSRGCNPTVLSISGDNLLHTAIRNGNAKLVETVLNQVPADIMQRLFTDKNKEQESVFDLPMSAEIRLMIDSQWLIILSLEASQLYKESRFEEALDRYMGALELCRESSSETRRENLVKLEYNCARTLFRLGRFVDSISHCNVCIELEPSYLNAYSQRAQASGELCDYVSAKKDYETLLSSQSEDARHVNDLRLKILELEQLLKTDHYTVLEIGRFSDEATVKSAYRKLARKFHPDKVMGESEDVRVRSRNQFARFQHAYEVLTGPGKEEYDLNLKIIAGTEAVRQSLLRRRSTMRSSYDPSPPLSPKQRQSRMRQFLGSPETRSFDVLFRN
jgi:tetratricopeptide (TPR) repeat protein